MLHQPCRAGSNPEGNLTAIIRCCNDPKCMCRAQEILRTQGMDSYQWRRERDSNPRYGFPYSGFQDRLFQPLTHPSATYKQFNTQYLLERCRCITSLPLHVHCTKRRLSASEVDRWRDSNEDTSTRRRTLSMFVIGARNCGRVKLFGSKRVNVCVQRTTSTIRQNRRRSRWALYLYNPYTSVCFPLNFVFGGE